LERAALAATPELVANRVMRDQGRLGIELPLWKVRLRGMLLGAVIESPGQRNERGGAEGGLALALSPTVTPWVRYQVSGYRDATDAGYFAPRRADGATVGSSFELGEGSPWLLELDAGGGAQRYATHGGPLGPWKPAAQAYAYASRRLGPGSELRLEAEGENSPGLATTTATSASWSYYSLTLSLRWALR